MRIVCAITTHQETSNQGFRYVYARIICHLLCRLDRFGACFNSMHFLGLNGPNVLYSGAITAGDNPDAVCLLIYVIYARYPKWYRQTMIDARSATVALIIALITRSTQLIARIQIWHLSKSFTESPQTQIASAYAPVILFICRNSALLFSTHTDTGSGIFADRAEFEHLATLSIFPFSASKPSSWR